MAKKRNDHIGGFDAPRNSLELQAESFQSCYTVREYEPYSNVARQNMPRSSSFSANDSMKKLISEEISRGSNHKQRSPSIVARLMGMDVFPSDTESIAEPFELKDDSPGIGGLQKQNREKMSTGYAHKKSYYVDKDLHSSDKHMCTHLLSNGTNLGKSRHRLHPQEKELQQFKKDFEAWQANRFLECAKVVDVENIPDQWLAQLDQTKKKMAAYENAKKAAREKAESLTRDALKPRIYSGGDQHYHGYKKSSFSPKHKKPHAFRSKSMDREFEELSMMDFDKRSNRSSTPARIVILKPGPESFSSNDDESWASSSGSVDDRDCIEDLLEEVKERLRSELHGKPYKRGSMIRGGGIAKFETPFKERPKHPNQRARDVKMQGIENSTGDFGRSFFRSESTRSHKSEIYPNSGSPEFTSQVAKQLLSKRFRSVLRGENHQDLPNIINCNSRGIDFDDTRGRLEQVRKILSATNEWNRWDDNNHGDYAEARSFRHEFAEEETFEEELSPRNLVRSLSAPVPGTSFGKLLLEDRHILTGAQVRRKHEALESLGLDDRKKERFKLREKVSNIRYNFTLKGKLFSRKFHSFDLSQENEYELMKDINSGPTVLMNLPDRNENYTEVPPSPASACSGTPEELWKPADHRSPISTSDITSIEDQSVGNALREISSNLNELRRDLDQIDLEESEVTTISDEPLQAEVESLEDEWEAYIRDLLVASGLYDGSSKNPFSTWDTYETHIDEWVYEKVEESYIKPNKEEGAASMDRNDEASFHHKMLFDLLNEALSIVIKPPKSLSRFRRNITGPISSQRPQGRTLLEKVWEIIRGHIYPSPYNPLPSLEDMVLHDLDFVPWFDLIDEELKAVGSEVEACITSELIEEIVKHM